MAYNVTQKMIDEIKADHKISAIKMFRELYGTGLRESKEVIDKATEQMHGRTARPVNRVSVLRKYLATVDSTLQAMASFAGGEQSTVLNSFETGLAWDVKDLLQRNKAVKAMQREVANADLGACESQLRRVMLSMPTPSFDANVPWTQMDTLFRSLHEIVDRTSLEEKSNTVSYNVNNGTKNERFE